jgi:hypothetical protein
LRVLFSGSQILSLNNWRIDIKTIYDSNLVF